MDDSTWMANARCRDMDPEFFFPSDGLGVEAAQKVCAECPTSAECLEYALAHHIDHGVWGGASERMRRRILRERRRVARLREVPAIAVSVREAPVRENSANVEA